MAKAVERDHRAPLVIHETRALACALHGAVCRAVVHGTVASTTRPDVSVGRRAALDDALGKPVR